MGSGAASISTARPDNAFNIDVKKSSLTLSEEAWRTISDKALDYKRKSAAAWKRAGTELETLRGKEPGLQVQNLVDALPIPESLPGKPALPEEVLDAESEAIAARMKARITKQAANYIPDETDPAPLPDAPPPRPNNGLTRN